MLNAIWQNDLLIWAVALVLGFPLLVIVLGEVIHRLKRRGKSLEATLQVVRNLVLPVFVFMLFIEYVLKLDANGNFVKSIETLFWICVLHASLSLVNAVLFAEAEDEVVALTRGEFFGEMALFSGEPSAVSVTAVEDLEVMVIYSNVVNEMIERQPSLAREIGQIIEARRKAIQMVKQADAKSKWQAEVN